MRDRELVALDWMWSHSKSPASKNEIFSELEPLDRGGGLGGAGDGDGGSNAGNVVMFFLSEIMAKNMLLKVSANGFRVKMFMSTTSLQLYYPRFDVHVQT
ncbi:LOW QUALITY PROTEIN: hypothetical protein YC2023_053430 [Brassica napus]